MELRFRHLAFQDLSVQALHDIYHLRVEVFVVEQQCAYAEVDGKDPQAWHVLGTNGQGRLIAYARVLPARGAEAAHIGRVVVSKEARGSGTAQALMHSCFALLRELHGTERNKIAAQAYLERFYQRLGYRTTSAPYDWDGIPHIDMVRDA